MLDITTVFIDIDNTLWHFSRNSDLALKEAFDFFNCSQWCSSYDEFYHHYEHFNHMLWQLYNQGEVEKDVLMVKRFEQALQACHHSGNTHELAAMLNATYLDRLVMHHELVPGAVELLQYLHDKGYEINALSNGFKGVQQRKLQAGGMNRFITHVVLSEDCGVTKPRRGIYDYAMKLCGVGPSHIVMIGDDPSTDVAGALAAGWHTIYFNLNHVPCHLAHHTVNSLLEIKDIL